MEAHLNLNLPPIILGGAGFGYQHHAHPETIPVARIIQRAFDCGITAIDTSPYYEPSEKLLGAALKSPEIRSKYARNEYILMTKAGRISVDKFDYSPEWMRKSVLRSLDRLDTSYLDVVFCHDVEFVSVDEAVGAVGALLELKKQGLIKFVGISGYSIDSLVRIARRTRAVYHRSLDIVQNWAQLTLQNSRLETYGIPALREQGVRIICNASPLASGLLRSGSLPLGRLGAWHPAPDGLSVAVKKSSDWVAAQGSSLANLALRYSIARAARLSSPPMSNGTRVHTIVGISSIADIEDNLQAVNTILRMGKGSQAQSLCISSSMEVDEQVESNDRVLCDGVRRILGDWVDYDFEKQQESSKL